MLHEKIGEKHGMGRREDSVHLLLAPSLTLLVFRSFVLRAAPQLTERMEEAKTSQDSSVLLEEKSG